MNIKKRVVRFLYCWLARIDQGGELPRVTTTKNNRIIIGLAAHDIEAGEIVEYRSGKNTSDIMARTEEKPDANTS